MTERPVQRTSTRTGTTRPENSPSSRPESASGASDDTAARAPLAERVQARLNHATSEHRANANPESRPAATKAARSGRPPRRARLRLSRIDPWSVMKTAFLLSIAFGVVTVVAVLMVWSVLGAAGVWDSINQTVQDVIGGQGSSSTFNVQDYLGTSRIVGFTVLVAVIDVVLLTAIATLAAFLYNMAAALLGGVEVTLAEDER
jgi:hypothetical protein